RHGAIEVRDVELARGVLAERRRPAARVADLNGIAEVIRPRIDREDPSAAVVREEVHAEEAQVLRTAVDVAANDGAAEVVAVFGHRQGQALTRALGPRRVAVPALHPVPAQVEPADAGASDVDLLPRTLADVADPQVAGRAIEGVAPRVAQPHEPDL